jgi:hypothetical protein
MFVMLSNGYIFMVYMVQPQFGVLLNFLRNSSTSDYAIVCPYSAPHLRDRPRKLTLE